MYQSSRQTSFEDLPDELVLDVFGKMDSTAQIQSLGRTSRRHLSIGKDRAALDRWYYLKCREVSGNPDEFDRYTRGQTRDYERDYRRGTFENAFDSQYFRIKGEILEHGDEPGSFKIAVTRTLKLLPREIGRLRNAASLRSAGKGDIGEIPDEIGNMQSLEYVDLTLAPGAVIPEAISRLNLETLVLRGKHVFDTIPPAICAIATLWRLEIRTTEIPRCVSNLRNLRELTVTNAGLARVPWDRLATLPIDRLSLSWNRIGVLTSDVSLLRSLEYLNLQSNGLTEIPEEIGELTSLRFLDLDDNPIERLPESMVRLTRLESLSIRDTRIQHVPDFLSQMNVEVNT